MKNFFQKYKHAWVLCYVFIYLPWFMWLEKSVTTDFHVMHITLDDYIPFNEYFIIPYLLWFLYVAGSILYFFFTNKEDYYRLCFLLFTGMTISLIICTLFPNGTDLRPVIDPNKNLFTAMVASLYQTDTSTNVFPSIHVFNSIGVHIAVTHSQSLKKYKWIQISSFILMISICLATVFLKQHSAIDGFGSIMMAYVLYHFAYANGYEPIRKKVTQKVIS